jgi:cell division protein ZapE
MWLDFDALCGPPRSQNDYIELARCHHTVLLSGVPVLDGSADDKARRFVLLVDELYDRGVKLVVSAAAPPERLYCGERLAFEFQRTASRLREMQSHDYLARPHRP